MADGAGSSNYICLYIYLYICVYMCEFCIYIMANVRAIVASKWQVSGGDLDGEAQRTTSL
jgi:hypothetical protein